jgi:Cu-Zn family superoxide dismutase
VVSETTDSSFAFPTTIAYARNRLLVVNSQFNRREEGPVLPFTVSSIRIP